MTIHDAFLRPTARARNITPRKTIVTNGYVNTRIDATAGSVRERNFCDRRNVIFSNKPLAAKRQTFYYRHNQHYQATAMRLRDLHRFDDAASRMHFLWRYFSNSENVCDIAESKTTISFNVTIVEKDK
ncbi:uncharacterized protein [Mycetomoellerius zeteki]|uniref:uncharacterized protein n=1 Tax=Mycetomoellerius zeteki TaxID=64791 RepID=UPI00084E77D8|nr:PREDICTED: uncharacterized protein LOC108722482 [Trachymyrmex zeteki]